MYLVAKQERMLASKTERGPKAHTAGLAGWLLEALASWRGSAARPAARKLKVVETLPLGAKRQLLLVSCGGERFLVGTGPECVQTIVRVRPESKIVPMEGPC